MIKREDVNLGLPIVIFFIVFVFLLFSFNAKADNIQKTIEEIAKQEGLDPQLAVAIATVESSLNPNAIGKHGEVGVFQLHPKFHSVHRGDTRGNIRVGIRYLLQVKRNCETKWGNAWFIGFNLGPNYSKPVRYPHLFPYYKKVIKNLTNTIAMN